MKNGALFWDVDTQYDFMRPEGQLYVPGAEGIIESVSEARRFALDNGYSILASMDWHREGNKEISAKPDFKRSFPAHCMADTPGSERVGYLGELAIEAVPNSRMDTDELRRLVDKKQFHIVIRREELDVFSNPNTAEIVRTLKPNKVVIFGVALDLCLRMVVEGLRKMGGMKLFVLRDAVKGLGITSDDDVIEKFRKKGVKIISVAELGQKF